MIPYGKQDVQQADIDAVVKVLQSDFLTQGPTVPIFEQEVAQFVGAAHGCAVNSATSALHIACKALELGPGDLLWTSPITFVASANCGIYCGAAVDFVDIDPDTYNMSPQRLHEKLQIAECEGRLPKVIVAVHMSGRSCDMQEIGKLASQYGVRLIEDASHAIGGSYKNARIGCCAYSDISVFSFHPVKIMTTGEGGMAVTNNRVLAERMELLRSHGITRDPNLMTNAPDGPWYYQQIALGWNYRMTDIQAALGREQLNRVDAAVQKRNALANRYDEAFQSAALSIPLRGNDYYSAFHLYVIQLTNHSRHRKIFEQLRSSGVGVNLHYIPVHLQPFYNNQGFKMGDFPAAESYYSRAISLPLFPTMTEAQQTKVIDVFLAALK